MLKRSLLLGLLLAVLILPGLTVPCAAQDGDGDTYTITELSESELQDFTLDQQHGSIVSTRGATVHSLMFIPYNIVSGNWITGLNFICLEANEELSVVYIHAGSAYHGFTISTTKNFSDITKIVNDRAFMNGIAFKSPTTLLISTVKGPFMVSQFIMNGSMGYGFQTFYSSQQGWPNP